MPVTFSRSRSPRQSLPSVPCELSAKVHGCTMQNSTWLAKSVTFILLCTIKYGWYCSSNLIQLNAYNLIGLPLLFNHARGPNRYLSCRKISIMPTIVGYEPMRFPSLQVRALGSWECFHFCILWNMKAILLQVHTS